MPYIKPIDRTYYESSLKELLSDVTAMAPNNDAIVGEVNYLITRILDAAFELSSPRYANINAAIGVLECAKLELYRRVAAPYEDTKIEENGDVYN